jgi:4-amino-4-deoxy-L-arabinose transferase-like glycosyltransferase
MSKTVRDWWLAIGIFFFSILLFYSYLKLKTPGYIYFSDGAKFADIAAQMVSGSGFKSNFTFFSPTIFNLAKESYFSARGVPPAMPLLISISFKLFRASDFSVIGVSAFFYLLLVISVFFLGKKLSSSLVGALAAIVVAANMDFLGYASSGASETLFAFLSVISTYLISIRKKWAVLLFILSLIFLYLTRPQGIFFILAYVLGWLLYRFSVKKSLIYFSIFVVFISIFDWFAIKPLSFIIPVYPVLSRGIDSLSQYSPNIATSAALRGGSGVSIQLFAIFKKIFYNLYNFYKLAAQIINPYLFGFYIVGLFIWTKDKFYKSLKISTIVAMGLVLFATAAAIPFFRYLHLLIPLVYIFAVEGLVFILAKIFADKRFVFAVSLSLIIFFVVGQTLGSIFLDSRFEKRTHNAGKPPIYVEYSKLLKDNTFSNQVVVTNLDTWGSWYGERKTVWFPLEPKQLIDPATNKIPFDAIYLTDYLMNDENYYMGDSWRAIFENPKDVTKWNCDGCDVIARDFVLKSIFTVDPADTYEKISGRAVLLVKKI